jgi:hypothetical protein
MLEKLSTRKHPGSAETSPTARDDPRLAKPAHKEAHKTLVLASTAFM